MVGVFVADTAFEVKVEREDETAGTVAEAKPVGVGTAMKYDAEAAERESSAKVKGSFVEEEEEAPGELQRLGGHMVVGAAQTAARIGMEDGMEGEDFERPWLPGIHAAVGFDSHCRTVDSVVFVVAVVVAGERLVAAAATAAVARIRLVGKSFQGFGSWHSDCPLSRDNHRGYRGNMVNLRDAAAWSKLPS